MKQATRIGISVLVLGAVLWGVMPREGAAHPAAPGRRGHHHPHEELPVASSEAPAVQGGPRLELLGYHDLGGGGLNADVWLHRGAAYVGTWQSDDEDGCPGTGVKVLDLGTSARSAPAQVPGGAGLSAAQGPSAQPELIGFLAQYPDTSAEMIRVRTVDTPHFRGDLLAVGLQDCTGEGIRGVDLWDVTDPRAPRRLSFFEAVPVGAPSETWGVHELDLVQRADGRVLALLAVPFSEEHHPEGLGDFRVVDVTDPRDPRELAAWGVTADLGLPSDGGQGSDKDVFAHSVEASPDGLQAYVSYWDAGVLLFDLADPAAPRLLGRTTVPPDEEGNAHSVDLARGGRVLIQADEVFDVELAQVRVESPAGAAGLIRGSGQFPGHPFEETDSVTAELAYLGRGCPAGEFDVTDTVLEEDDPYPTDPSGRIALLDRGVCPFLDKLERAKAAGAVGAVIVNRDNSTFAPTSPDGQLGAIMISRPDGERLRADLAANRSVRVTLDAELLTYQDWGGLTFWDIANPATPRALSTFRTAMARVDRRQGPAAAGTFTAHNPVVQGDLVFVSWYSDGVRVLDIRDPAAPRELTAWVPPVPELPNAVQSDEGAQVWGVAVDRDLVVLSDVNSGLYVLRLVRE